MPWSRNESTECRSMWPYSPISLAIISIIHGTMEKYFAAKTVLFTGSGTEPPRAAVINIEDEYGQRIVKLLKKQQELITYGIDGGDFRAKDVSIETSGTKFTLVTPTGQYPVWSSLLGRVNVLNLIAASAAAYARNLEPQRHRRGSRCTEPRFRGASSAWTLANPSP